MTLDEVLQRIIAVADGPVAAERIPIVEGLDRTLAEAVISSMDLPPWDASGADGFAIRSADVERASDQSPVSLRLVAELRAGAEAASLEPGECVRIGIGARLPEEADAVIPLDSENATAAGGTVTVSMPIPPRYGVKPRGSEVTTGQLVIAQGTRLRPGHLALAGAVGAGDISVYRRPVACVLSVGDELRFPGQWLGPAGVPDANRPGLLTLCRRAGAWAVDVGIASDSVEAVTGALRPMIDRADVILTTGAVSAAPYDAVTRAMEGLGSVERLKLDGLAGRTFAVGAAAPRPADGRRVLLFGLPGSPGSAFTLFELVVRPSLDRLAGRAPTVRRDRGVLVEGLPQDVSAPAYAAVIAIRDEHGVVQRDETARALIRPNGLVGPEEMAGLGIADALATIESGEGPIGAGTEVEIRWLAE